MNMDFFIVPTIDDGIATWKLVVRYENNDELAIICIYLIMSQLRSKFEKTFTLNPLANSKKSGLSIRNQDEDFKKICLRTNIMKK